MPIATKSTGRWVFQEAKRYREKFSKQGLSAHIERGQIEKGEQESEGREE